MRVLYALLAVLAAVAANADDAATYQLGKHYHEIATPVKTRNSDKIEVTEVFWYGCGHCYTFAPLMRNWEQQQADDVVVRHVPAIWRDSMDAHARIYYTMKVLGKEDKMHMAVFRALHEDNKRLTSEKEIAELFAKHGVDEETFNKTYNSFGVKSQVQQADAKQRAYGVTRTPTLVVDGRYRVSSEHLKGQEEWLKATDFLVNKIRQEKK